MTFVQTILKNARGDRSIWIVFGLLCLASMLAVYSSAGIMEYRFGGSGAGYHIMKHFLVIMAGCFIVYVVHQIPYQFFSAIAPSFLVLTIGLLILTMFVGDEVNDARRWLSIPLIGLTFQTSDLAKVAIILFLARNISTKQAVIKDFKTAFIPLLLPIVVICMLIAPADLSSAMILFATCLVMLFVGRIKVKYIGLIFLCGIICLALLVLVGQVLPDFTRFDTWMSRINDFVMGEASRDNIQAKIAIAQGGWLGQGPGNSIQRNFIAYPYADFIFAIICEEYGVVGAFGILFLYILLLFRCTKLLTRSRKAFGALLAFGLCMSIVLQALANIAVSVHLVPATGLTLPMVSMGGTSLFFTALQFGIILSVSRQVERDGIHLKEKSDEDHD
ncbi:FtsW/RodA/SpoVE family cell cycle protein [Membranicola marinus]|uniref:Probable peptidoglycan glycosyltransferase FtsW n=1 Tax=Membranihabitans marinus TaxID=1227546 RepID=A0A953HSR0_9BACT|nr:FtsW/RodA/SpoVE family cell cycle protein [Membranihabitans marinus]MBY5957546.1 FtsW/RodA/SpoVE family cell cycle protein [Membranihabitans marinus]